MSEPVYLWNWYRTRRHIDSGETASSSFGNPRPGYHWSLCGQAHSTEAETHNGLVSWHTPKRCDDLMAKAWTVPVCKHCLRIQATQ